jgi:putative transcriptional regulator
MKNTLKIERAKQNITQSQLAEIINVSRKTINDIENGKSIPSITISLKISQYFNLTVNDIFKL